MKLLVVSNFYPPYKIGGYELLCEEVVQALNNLGHRSKILTSTFGVGKPVVEGNVHRELTLENDLDYYALKKLWAYPRQRIRNERILREVVLNYQPDLIFIWGMWALSKNIAFEAEKLMGARVVYYLANPWPIQPSLHKDFWDKPERKPWKSTLKQALRIAVRSIMKDEWEQAKLKYLYSPICSEATKKQLLDAGIPLKNAPVIYEGINLEPYLEQASKRDFRNLKDRIALLYVGILAPHKGIHTAIEALAHLGEANRNRLKLTILGDGQPGYVNWLRSLVDNYKLDKHVDFHEPIPRVALPDFLGKYDVLILPSIWEEPLALIMQEGLAAGMVVVGSSTGGTKEIIKDNENGMLFEAGNSRDLAEKFDRLVSNTTSMQRFSENGRKTAQSLFDLRRMVSDLEAYLEKVMSVENAPDFLN